MEDTLFFSTAEETFHQVDIDVALPSLWNWNQMFLFDIETHRNGKHNFTLIHWLKLEWTHRI
ncbi:hypothetical protein LguiA_033548 [Lonicera macranthoides]